MTKEEWIKLKEEFGEYLRNNWDDRENLPVADWWIEKIKSVEKEAFREGYDAAKEDYHILD